MERSIIITAGGIGKRMGGNQPKQFLMLAGKPVLMHTIERLHAFDPTAQLIITLPQEHISSWEILVHQFSFPIQHEIVAGGKERFHSIQNALPFCKGNIIAVHDGVRPFVSNETLVQLFSTVLEKKAVIPVVLPKESMRKVDGEESHAVERSAYRIVQTPQVFTAEILRKAYEQPFTDFITDDASLVEQLGVKIHLVEGNEENIKLTTPIDLVLGELILKNKS